MSIFKTQEKHDQIVNELQRKNDGLIRDLF